MKKLSFYALIIIVGVIGIIIYFGYFRPNANTIEGRQALLDSAIPSGKDWLIAKEIKIDDYIISAAYSSNSKSTIAVFEPTSNGKYRFSTSTNRDSNEIIIGGATINGYWYDLVWFNGAQTKCAEIIYIINGKKNEALRYDTTNMDIIYNKNPQKEYSMEVYYYDNEGNRYE